jgi:hypothetical protein
MLLMPECLDRIHYSNESRLVLDDDKDCIWYCDGGDNPAASIASAKLPPSLMTFAVIGIGCESDFLLVEENIDTDRYVHHLDRRGFVEALDAKDGAFGWILRQDGAPAYTSQKALDWLEESVDVIVDWPANSPDLSPIESLWVILKKLINRFDPQNMEELKSAVVAAWALIPHVTIDKLCQGFQRHLQLWFAKGGESISTDLW